MSNTNDAAPSSMVPPSSTRPAPLRLAEINDPPPDRIAHPDPLNDVVPPRPHDTQSRRARLTTAAGIAAGLVLLFVALAFLRDRALQMLNGSSSASIGGGVLGDQIKPPPVPSYLLAFACISIGCLLCAILAARAGWDAVGERLGEASTGFKAATDKRDRLRKRLNEVEQRIREIETAIEHTPAKWLLTEDLEAAHAAHEQAMEAGRGRSRGHGWTPTRRFDRPLDPLRHALDQQGTDDDRSAA